MKEEQLKELIKSCMDAKENAYAPYSKFKVGAALLCTDGSIVKGCNVENCVYTLGVCAERTAVAKAVSEGKRNFLAIAVISDCDDYISPCGACRQVLSEFNRDMPVYLCKPDGTYQSTSVSVLLPGAFAPEHLSNTGK